MLIYVVLNEKMLVLLTVIHTILFLEMQTELVFARHWDLKTSFLLLEGYGVIIHHFVGLSENDFAYFFTHKIQDG